MPRLLVFRQLESKGIPWCADHIRRLVKAGKFPAPIKLGDQPSSLNAWVEPEIDRYVEEKLAARNLKQGGADEAA